ncbi:efflux RND transporter periplasmic adaptor subunit [Catenuloplanes japonicus]|uniref:efflux RND transporter periplasmic adaptor subunit n=1 Tax=Catenuloplanes japonicus TaxID=33876 RepID=UPI000A518B72|nr:efflux RND transporter periplasmic adaptor subunit [Catenuloplanes japonicus]
MGRRRLLALVPALAIVTGCSLPSGEEAQTPTLEAPDTVLTTVQPTRQDLTNAISLTGKVSIDPVFGIVSPVSGEIRWASRQPTGLPAEEELWVASIWKDGEPHAVNVPIGAIYAGRLAADKTKVTEGMPVVSAKHSGYAIVAEISSEHAYRLTDSVESVKAQIKNGPGPFDCKPLGAIAALPAGTVPAAPEPTGTPDPAEPQNPGGGGSEATGLRLVCTAPNDVKLINGVEVTLEMVTAKAAGVLVLPVEAVAGSQGKGKVDLVDANRQRTTVDVELGLTDGKVVEIKSGLKGDETVAIPGPNLPDAPPQDAGGGSGAPGLVGVGG